MSMNRHKSYTVTMLVAEPRIQPEPQPWWWAKPRMQPETAALPKSSVLVAL